MRSGIFCLVVLAALFASPVAAAQSRKKSLKDFSPKGKVFPVDSYHGFIGVGNNGGDLFYWWFPSKSDPAKDPLIIWLTGGPGASSMLGLMYENGPIMIDQQSGQVVENPFSWNQKANLLYVDQPFGVGYSHGLRDLWPETEVEAAEWFLEFFTKFLQAYPEFKSRDLYLTGDSYAGHYIPFFAKKLKDSADPAINLKGIAIGNGMTNARQESLPYGDFAMLPENLQYTKMTQQKYDRTKKFLQVCQYMIQSESPMIKGLGTYKFCEYASNLIRNDDNGNPIFDQYDIRISASVGAEKSKRLALNMNTFLNSPEVLNELKVEHEWSLFNDDFYIRMVRRDWIIDCSVPISQLLDQGLPVLIYAGDKDFICNWVGNKEYISHMSWSGAQDWAAAQEQDYHGYGKSWKAKNLQFVVVFDAGHLVPHNQPANSLDMLNRFLAGTD